MSNEAITWALGLKVGRSSAKFVLVAMANLANADMTCWPSVKYLSDATCQDRKTVLDNIKRLKAGGFIVDTNERKGVTGSVPVYRLSDPENGTATPTIHDCAHSPGDGGSKPENGTSTENVAVPKTDGSSPVFPGKQSRFSREAVPKTDGSSPENGTRIPKEPTKEPKGKPKDTTPEKSGDEKYSALDALIAIDVERQIAKDWLAVRKLKGSAPTKTAIDKVLLNIAAAGMSANDALRICCERSWAGFNKVWLDAERATPQARASPVKESRHAGFEKINYSEGITEDGRIT